MLESKGKNCKVNLLIDLDSVKQEALLSFVNTELQPSTIYSVQELETPFFLHVSSS